MLAMVRGPLGGGRASITTGLLCEVWDDGKLPQPRKMMSKHRQTGASVRGLTGTERERPVEGAFVQRKWNELKTDETA